MERSSALRLSQEVDRVELLAVVDRLIAVGIAYEHFEQLHATSRCWVAYCASQ